MLSRHVRNGLIVTLACAALLVMASAVSAQGRGRGRGRGKGQEKGRGARPAKVEAGGGGGLAEAKERLRTRHEERLRAALEAMEQAHNSGVPAGDAERMADEGLNRGLEAKDFEPLGRFVARKHEEGLKGKDLADAIHEEVRSRQELRKQARQTEGKDKGKGPEKAGAEHDRGKDKGKGLEKAGAEHDRGKDKDKGKEGKGEGRGRGKKEK